MGTSLRNRVLAWLIRFRPAIYLRFKGLGVHRLGEARLFLELHADLVAHGEGLSTLRERYNLWMLAGRLAGRPGAIAEFGVYRGASARLLAAATIEEQRLSTLRYRAISFTGPNMPAGSERTLCIS